MASRHIYGGFGKPAEEKNGIVSRIKDAFSRRRMTRLAAWLEAGADEFPAKLASKIGVENTVIAAHHAYMGGCRENALEALRALGDGGRNELRSLCIQRAGAERAIALEMLGHAGDACDLEFIPSVYFEDPNLFVKKSALSAAGRLAERFSGRMELDACVPMVADAICEDSLGGHASVIAGHFNESQGAALAESSPAVPAGHAGIAESPAGRTTKPGLGQTAKEK